MAGLMVKLRLPTRVQPEVHPAPDNVGVYTNKIHYLRKYVLDELSSKKFAMDFMEPVDTVALNIPTYFTVIQNPMDIGTIQQRVQNLYYHNVDELISDFKLVISNCYLFNQPGDVVYRSCQKMERFISRVLKKLPRGEEKASPKDPRAGRNQRIERAPEAVQRQCRELLRKLTISIELENSKDTFKYFNIMWNKLYQKVEANEFKTVEEFHIEMKNMFKNFDNQLEMLQKSYRGIDEQENIPVFEESKISKAFDKDIAEVLVALKISENAVEECAQAYSSEKEQHAKNMLKVYTDAVNKLKFKLRNENQNTPYIEEEVMEAQDCNNQQSFEEGDNEDIPISQAEEINSDMEIEESPSASPDGNKTPIAFNEIDSTTAIEKDAAASPKEDLWEDLEVSSSDSE